MNLTVPVEIERAATVELRKLTASRVARQAVPVAAVLGLLAGGGFALRGNGPQPHETLATGTASAGFYVALFVTLAAAAIFAALAAGDEYRHHSLALTAVFTPDRDLLMGAKLGVTAAYSLLLGVSVEVGALLGLLAAGRHRIEFGVRLLSVFGGGLLAVVCWSLLGAALGLLFRSPGPAVLTLILWPLIAEPAIWYVARFVGVPGFAVLFPLSATVGAVMNGSFPKTHFLAPSAASAVVLVLWTAGVCAGAWWYVRRRDL
ncbi:ABC transporter permease [Nocardia sp. alder85J]|uniref:ABC transporter permease n=1 Tax=Nocardia sp. alder85J TaxID=2862949 RepID=UPI001CD79614|nr:ABC transporter permease [Nocardia sp. alder85J]MCX4095984.1 ABC transporter permease [Nocardia sp. alder85J]